MINCPNCDKTTLFSEAYSWEYGGYYAKVFCRCKKGNITLGFSYNSKLKAENQAIEKWDEIMLA
jgi:hypothetical protein